MLRRLVRGAAYRGKPRARREGSRKLRGRPHMENHRRKHEINPDAVLYRRVFPDDDGPLRSLDGLAHWIGVTAGTFQDPLRIEGS